MTDAEVKIATALGQCSFLPASWDKKFARSLASAAEHMPERDLTERQIAHMLRLTHKYRRQIPTRVIELALDEMERHADRRVASGLGALPDFTPARGALKAQKVVPQGPQLSMFDGT